MKTDHYVCSVKKGLAVILAYAILAQSFVQVGVSIYYHANKAYIAKQLCENRQNPQSHCNGHCYLSKQLKKAEEREQKQTASLLKGKEEVYTNQYDVVTFKCYPSVVGKSYVPYNPHLTLTGFSQLPIKPPAA